MTDYIATTARAGLMGPGDVSKLDKLVYLAAVDPTSSDDITKEFFVGARWYNSATNKEFVCIDSSAGSAVWKSPAGSGGTATDTNVSYVIGMVGGSF